MRNTLTSHSSAFVLTSAFALGVAACSGSSTGTGTAGTTGGGTAGTGSAGQAGTSGGSAGTSGTAGTTGTGAAGTSGTGTAGTSGTGAAGTTGTGTAGTSGTGTAGTSGTAGHAGGTTGTAGTTGGGGMAGTGSGFTPFACSGTFSSPTSFPAGSSATRIAGAPPSDTFNNNGNNFTNVEGPVWITNALYVSEFGSMATPPPSRIIKIDASDNVSVAFPSVADTGSNGLAVDGNGNIVSANHGVGGIVGINLSTGAKTTLTDVFSGKRFNSPNDLTIRSDGTIYFTDPCCFQGTMTQANQGVYMLPPGSSTATEILSTLNGPNGITLSLDEKTLYVGDNGDGVSKYTVNANGSIGATGTAIDTTDLAHENTDGMAIDCAGDVYVVRVNEHDIIVVNPAGTKIGDITTIPGGGQLSNVAFGGTDHKTLYITSQGTGTQRGVFKLPMSVPGMPY
jgi:gluconolactonase